MAEKSHRGAVSFLFLVHEQRKSPGDPCWRHMGLLSVEGSLPTSDQHLGQKRGGHLHSEPDLELLRAQPGGRGGADKGRRNPGESWSVNL